MKKNELYINVTDYVEEEYPYQFFVGGRGRGKTYSGLRAGLQHYLKTGERFIYMRRTEKELKRCMVSRIRGSGLNPFKSLNEKEHYKVAIFQTFDEIGEIHDYQISEKGAMVACGDHYGYACTLTGMAGIRGIDLSDCGLLIYDEFITERHVRKITGESDAFFNAIETIGRNREMDEEGSKPFQVWCFANAFNIYNPLFQGLGVIGDIEKVISRKQESYKNLDRGLAIHILEDNPLFTEKKANTSLYKLTKGTSFYDMALGNEFVYNDFSLVGFQNVKGYQPCAGVHSVIGDFYIWRKKGEERYYVTYYHQRMPMFDCCTTHERKAFMQSWGRELLQPFIEGRVKFESYEIKQTFLDIMNVK